jgi:DNA-binding GntR family transcriptional regulator
MQPGHGDDVLGSGASLTGLHTVCSFAVPRILEDGQAPLNRNASVAATELIRAAIVEGRLEPGQRLKEEELARELGISRTPVREALLFLQAEGLVESEPNRGATVRAYEPEEIEDMYELRALLEGHAAHRAATRISEEDLGRLRESNERFATLGAENDVVDLVRENLAFHNTVLEAAGSERLAAMVRKVIELPLVYKSFYWYSPEQKLISDHYHRELTRALEARDAERAELIMKEHVFEARDFLIATLKDRS